MTAAEKVEQRLRKWGYKIEATSFPEIDVTELTIDGGPMYVQVNDEGDGAACFLLWRGLDPSEAAEHNTPEQDVEHALIGTYDTEEQLLAAIRHRLPAKEEA